MAHDDGIVVIGRGSVAQAPDTVVVTMGVSVRTATAPESIAEAARAAASLVSSLHDAGVAAADISTSHYGIHQEYRHTDGGSIPDGYRVVNTINATIRDVANVGAVIDAAAAAAGDAIEVQGISFGISDDTSVRAQARDLAFADAVATATQLATLAGRSLGAAQSIRESAAYSPGAPGGGVRRAMAADASTPVSGGELSTAVQIEVRFSFAD